MSTLIVKTGGEKMNMMMDESCAMCGWMMAGAGLLSVLLIVFLVLGIVALVKYLRSGRK